MRRSLTEPLVIALVLLLTLGLLHPGAHAMSTAQVPGVAPDAIAAANPCPGAGHSAFGAGHDEGRPGKARLPGASCCHAICIIALLTTPPDLAGPNEHATKLAWAAVPLLAGMMLGGLDRPPKA